LDQKISRYWKTIQASLFPDFEQEVGYQTQKHGQIMVVLDVLDLDRFHMWLDFSNRGRPPRNRIAIAKAFVAKSVLNLPSTVALIDRLRIDKVLRRICGFETNMRLPCEGTFSNAFAEFSRLKFPEKIHETVIKTIYSERIVGHISRDSTDISARGKASKKKKRKKKRARGKNRRIVRQREMSLEQMLSDLPTKLDASCKRKHSWKGFKLHLDAADSGVPISSILTSASLHDSQAAIPLEEKTSGLVTSLYSLMDSAYDSNEIREHVSEKNKVAIIYPQKRPHQKVVLNPAEKRRYGERTTVERVYGRLKDDFGGRQVRVQGASKVFTHLLFGILALTAEQIVRHLS